MEEEERREKEAASLAAGTGIMQSFMGRDNQNGSVGPMSWVSLAFHAKKLVSSQSSQNPCPRSNLQDYNGSFLRRPCHRNNIIYGRLL
jgi:hypothetical protein